jgi:hypothetical protein
MLKKLQDLDSRIIYLVLLVAISLPMFNPLGLPVSVIEQTRRVYDFIEELEPGSVVVMSMDYSPGAAPEIHPQAIAITKHLFSKNMRVMFMGISQYASQFARDAIKEALTLHEAEYGVDYVDLGFKPGEEATVTAMGRNVHNTFPEDTYGTPVSQIPMMADIQDANDFAMVIAFDSGGSRHYYVGQINSLYGTPIACALNSVNVTNTMPYYASGQVLGILNGVRGAAEYEQMIGSLGTGTTNLDSISFGHLVIIFFIIIGNISYFASGRKPSKREVR